MDLLSGLGLLSEHARCSRHAERDLLAGPAERDRTLAKGDFVLSEEFLRRERGEGTCSPA